MKEHKYEGYWVNITYADPENIVEHEVPYNAPCGCKFDAPVREWTEDGAKHGRALIPYVCPVCGKSLIGEIARRALEEEES